jgi:hypothetical protein
MRAVKIFFAGSVGAGTLALAMAACGGSSQAPPGGAIDSGVGDGTTPTTDSSFADSPVGPDANDGACVFTDANLNTATPPDAALDDAGASVGTCLSCAQANCQSDVTACNGDCACETVFDCAFNCLSSVGGSLEVCYIECGGSLTGSKVDPVETSLGECALKQCPTECAVCTISPKLCPAEAGTPVNDAGTDASDAAADAAED